MNKKEKEQYKKKMLEKKSEMNHRVSEFYSDSMEIDTGIVQDVGDRAESSYTKEFLLSLSDTEREEVLMVEEALRRIEACTYGICQMCGQAIVKKRLDVVPWAPYCLNCQKKTEEESS